MPTKIVYQIFNTFNNKIYYLFLFSLFCMTIYKRKVGVLKKKLQLLCKKHLEIAQKYIKPEQ